MQQGIARKAAVCLTAGLLALLSASEGRANLIVNGSFESGISPPSAILGYRTLSGPGDPLNLGGTGDIAGWTVRNDNIDWIHNSYWLASNGTYSLDLSGLTPGGIGQTLATNPGESYTLSFDLSVNPDLRHSETARRLDIFAVNGATNVNDLEDNRLIGRGTRTFTDMQWEQHSFTFTASGSSTRIEFISSMSNNDAGGPALDNVVLLGNGAPVPIPAPAGLILAGFGGLSLLVARKRKPVPAVA